ncbi:MAG: glycosyltransferase family 2 protein [Verrucomicrobiota bacterium]
MRSLPDKNKILVLIPAWDEEKTIGDVVKSLLERGFTRVRVVDNGSTDRTVQEAEASGAEVVREPRRGYGRACWSGLQDMPCEIEWILFCDGDGSDDLSRLDDFLQETTNGSEMILGNRRAYAKSRKALTPVQLFGNWLAGKLIFLGWGKKFEDLGPLRLIRRKTLEMMRMEDRGFGWTVEMQAKAAELGIPTSELPVQYFSRKGGKSKISGTVKGSFNAGIIILSTLGKLMLKSWLKKINHFINQKWMQIFLTIASTAFLFAGAMTMKPYGDFAIADNVLIFLKAAFFMMLGFSCSWLIKKWLGWRMLLFWIVAVGTRLLLLGMHPGDDIWRYLWEGIIQSHGFSPYHYTPNAEALTPLRTEWWHLINHREVSAAYPPLVQLIFKSITTVSSTVLMMKASILLADLITLCLLASRFGLGRSVWYAWNPLIIYSFAGGGHYDSFFILCLTGAWLLWDKRRHLLTWSGIVLLLGSSVAIKWVTLPILCYAGWKCLRECGFVKATLLGLLSLLPFTISLLLVCHNHYELPFKEEYNLSLKSTVLYFKESFPIVPGEFAQKARSAEFIPHFLLILWPGTLQMNWIFSIPLVFATLWFLVRAKDFHAFSENYFFWLLILAPMIHAWYFTWLVPFAVFSRNKGTLLISLSSFLYFLLKYRYELANAEWIQPIWEKTLMWTPFILGFIWSSHLKAKK